MLERDRNQPPFNDPIFDEPRRYSDPGSPLPRFEIQKGKPGGAHEATSPSVSPSLAPVASDVTDEDWAPAPISPAVRRFRAAALFATIIVPICLLAAFEVVTIGADAFRNVLPAAEQHMTAAQSWGAALTAGGNETRVIASDRAEPLTDDEARDRAAMALEQVMGLARVACVDEGMSQTTLWVTATVTPDGKVASIAVEGTTHGRPHVASCVGGIARNLHISEFRGEPVVASQEITLW